MHSTTAGDKVQKVFPGMCVYKSAKQNKFFSGLGIPSYLRDWLIARFADSSGAVDVEEIRRYVKQYIPRRDHWELLKGEMIKGGRTVHILAKARVEMDVRTGEALFGLPDLGFPSRRYEAVIADKLVHEKREALLSSSETWGVVDLEWRRGGIPGDQSQGRVFMVDFKPFRPYEVDLEFYQEARREFTLEEWIDILLMAVDYNPLGFVSETPALSLLTRLLPFLEKRLNLIELAPKGTGKSYVFSQVSKYGWLVSGGSVTRARLFYDLSRKAVGLVSRYDYVALDEVQTITFPDEEEVRGALKGFLESGEYRVGDYRGTGDAGLVLLGNMNQERTRDGCDMLRDLPEALRESALVDRFHGFIRGWDVPRMRENMKAEGWALNAEYFSEILHALRGDIRYRAVVDELLHVPKGADTRDTESVKRLTTGLVKLLFPHFVSIPAASLSDFDRYCLQPAIRMRSAIRRQLHMMDAEYGDATPEITCVEGSSPTGCAEG